MPAMVVIPSVKYFGWRVRRDTYHRIIREKVARLGKAEPPGPWLIVPFIPFMSFSPRGLSRLLTFPDVVGTPIGIGVSSSPQVMFAFAQFCF